jgi:hypothetical protein
MDCDSACEAARGGVIHLEAEDLGLDESKRSAVDLDEAFAFLLSQAIVSLFPCCNLNFSFSVRAVR